MVAISINAHRPHPASWPVQLGALAGPTVRELLLMYFDRFNPDILGLLEVIEDQAGLDEEKRRQLVDAYMDIVAEG